MPHQRFGIWLHSESTMKHATTFLAILAMVFLGSCVGLEYPDYWDFDHSVLRNILTLPFEIVFTPIIFILKLLPVL